MRGVRTRLYTKSRRATTTSSAKVYAPNTVGHKTGEVRNIAQYTSTIPSDLQTLLVPRNCAKSGFLSSVGLFGLMDSGQFVMYYFHLSWSHIKTGFTEPSLSFRNLIRYLYDARHSISK